MLLPAMTQPFNINSIQLQLKKMVDLNEIWKTFFNINFNAYAITQIQACLWL
jgi:hypothetical protein